MLSRSAGSSVAARAISSRSAADRNAVEQRAGRDIVSKFEPTILCNIRSWNYTTFPGHFDMLGPARLHGIQPRADDASAAASEGRGAGAQRSIIAHFDPLMWVIENPATGAYPSVHGASALGGRDPLQVRNSVQEADAAVDQHALEAEARPAQARQPLRGVAGRQAPPRRAAGAAADGGSARGLEGPAPTWCRRKAPGVSAFLKSKITAAATTKKRSSIDFVAGAALSQGQVSISRQAQHFRKVLRPLSASWGMARCRKRDRLRQAEQKFREAAEKNARLEEALRDLNSKLDQLALMTNCARAVCLEAKAASASA